MLGRCCECLIYLDTFHGNIASEKKLAYFKRVLDLNYKQTGDIVA